MCRVLQKLRMFCLDKIMLIFKIPKCLHFERTLMPMHFPHSITSPDLPALHRTPARQAGRESRWPPAQLPALHRRGRLQGLGGLRSSPLPKEGRRDGSPPQASPSQLGLLSVVSYDASEMHRSVPGRRQRDFNGESPVFPGISVARPGLGFVMT